LVERNLAKVEVESSRLFSRSKFEKEAVTGFLFSFAFLIWLSSFHAVAAGALYIPSISCLIPAKIVLDMGNIVILERQ
jgi:hypothetical protein